MSDHRVVCYSALDLDYVIFFFAYSHFFFGILGRNNSVDDGLCRRASRMLPRTDQTGG